MLSRILGLTAAVALIASASASASTLTMNGTTAVYTGATGAVTDITVTQTGTTNPDSVIVTRNTGGGGSDNDPITVGTGCVETVPGTTYQCDGATAFSADTGDGNDTVDASALAAIPTTLVGGTGDDGLTGGAAANTLSGGDGSDFLSGGAAADTLDGGAGDDTLVGLGGNDSLSGGDGGDTLFGGTGTDVVSGGAGNDFFSQFYETVTNGTAPEQDTGDVYSGGDGFDTFQIDAENDNQAGGGHVFTPLNSSVTLDDVANDGASGQAANVKSDIEAVNVSTQATAAQDATSGGTNTITGSAGINQITGSVGDDTIDPGAGNDIVNAGYGNDTVNARDGYADFITCGPGTDTANVDSLDTVAADCETVNRVDVGNANEDKPPAITLTGPANLAKIANTAPTTFTANVTDDHGVKAVLFTANGRLVCSATTAPYTCAYQPTGADVGRTALVAVAVDSGQQTATAETTVIVGRFGTSGFTASVSPKSDKVGAARFTTTGKVSLPSTVLPADGCGKGAVVIKISAAGRTISTRRTTLQKDCTYKNTVTFGTRTRFARSKTLVFKVEFLGNTVLNHTRVIRRSVRV